MLNGLTNDVTAVTCHIIIITVWPGLASLPASVSLAPLESLCSNALVLSPTLIDQIRLSFILLLIEKTRPGIDKVKPKVCSYIHGRPAFGPSCAEFCVPWMLAFR